MVETLVTHLLRGQADALGAGLHLARTLVFVVLLSAGWSLGHITTHLSDIHQRLAFVVGYRQPSPVGQLCISFFLSELTLSDGPTSMYGLPSLLRFTSTSVLLELGRLFLLGGWAASSRIPTSSLTAGCRHQPAPRRMLHTHLFFLRVGHSLVLDHRGHDVRGGLVEDGLGRSMASAREKPG